MNRTSLVFRSSSTVFNQKFLKTNLLLVTCQMVSLLPRHMEQNVRNQGRFGSRIKFLKIRYEIKLY